MDFKTFFKDKSLKAKQKTEFLGNWILENAEKTPDLLAFARTVKGAEKGTCMEAFEFATRKNIEIGTLACFDFAVESLTDPAPRVKWESAKVIANIAKRHSDHLEKAVAHLHDNTSSEGTVVRWSAALALSEIMNLKTPLNTHLIPLAEALHRDETQNSIRKMYGAALKKVGKN